MNEIKVRVITRDTVFTREERNELIEKGFFFDKGLSRNAFFRGADAIGILEEIIIYQRNKFVDDFFKSHNITKDEIINWLKD